MTTGSTQVQFRRGGSSSIAAFIGASGEVVVNTDTNQIVVQDGISLGGWTGARIVDLNNSINSLSGGLACTGSNLQNQINSLSGYFIGLPQLYIGSGSPEGIVSAISGSLYTDWFNVELYQKITGVSINGWK